jgi:RyR domain
MDTKQIARIAHEINRSYCIAIGDKTQVAWEDAPQWQQDSAINGVTMHINNPGSTPEESHANWMREKLENGWVYGPEKNPEKKEHPCMVDYKDLPVEQQIKDHLFESIVHLLSAGIVPA